MNEREHITLGCYSIIIIILFYKNSVWGLNRKCTRTLLKICISSDHLCNKWSVENSCVI